MASLNSCQILGAVITDPVTTLVKGKKVVSLKFVSKRRYHCDEEKILKEEATELDIEVIGKAVNFTEEYIRVGALIMIEGSIRKRSNGEAYILTRVVSRMPRVKDGKPEDHA